MGLVAAAAGAAGRHRGGARFAGEAAKPPPPEDNRRDALRPVMIVEVDQKDSCWEGYLTIVVPRRGSFRML
ncbi:hypothetical protein M7I_7749 [Glarea lozoyensis 74030]|uniref:Uncharacterized protein n=1 Tax=Glarea lozoyensis (strain ATCC 74030 / MF5533) TaxID=1104152 RepID=H0EY52_GLAL7|nr:hypothetical protein M7I_7749 [Glarea lozoyensis 74030]